MKIIQISDLHFGRHDELIIESFLEEMGRLKPEIIIISGDLTQRAKEGQYKLFNEFLQRLSSTLLIVPGNHDIPLHAPYSRFFHPFKLYKEFVSPDLECNFTNNEVNILGVNSVTPFKIKDGILSNPTLNLIQNHFSEASRQLNIVFFHHNLQYFEGMHHPLTNADQFMSYLMQSPIHIVCTGHLHYANLKLISKKQNQQCLLLHAGSLCCRSTNDRMNSYYVIDTEQLKCTINWRVFAKNSFYSRKVYQLNFNGANNVPF